MYLVSFHSVRVMCLDGGLQRQSDLLGASAWSPLVKVSRPIRSSCCHLPVAFSLEV